MRRGKNKIFYFLIFIAVLVLIGVGFLIFKNVGAPSKHQPADFNFVFNYGVGAKNELNTFNQSFTKDMIMDPPVTIKLKLTDSEMANVYKKIYNLKLFNSDRKKSKNIFVTPCSSYHLKVQTDSAQRELFWDDCNGKVDDKFRKFTDYILKIIESKEEYKKLPIPRGGYI